MHAIIELLHHGDTLPWASVLGHDLPQTFSTNSVEGLGQVDLGGEKVSILFPTFFLQLPTANTMVVVCSLSVIYTGFLVEVPVQGML